MFRNLTIFATLLALLVIVLGAYVRLSDAGLGCPDWPGCYGSLILDESEEGVAHAAENYDRPLEASKAWKEMIHRYFASTLGFIILILTYMAWKRPEIGQRGLTTSLSLLVMFQGALGMWTVTLLVKPVIVMSHLLGGLATLSLLLLLLLRVRKKRLSEENRSAGVLGLAVVALFILVAQIALGGWTSTNYAALACPEFPTCYGDSWAPSVDYKEGFVLWRGLGVDYEFGVLTNEARAAIHWVHRIGALITTIILLFLTTLLFKLRAIKESLMLGGLLLTQVVLGILNVLLNLPLHVAVAHNAVAALLLLSLVYVVFRLNKEHVN
ncbi:MAG: cytochrome B [Cycloclasticus sp. symbiont of Bathymodiolus heckerae]|nr:MAG: cytochrome B [Cycloclasticus sp. symbiont of Bathymodiolus heckerae]